MAEEFTATAKLNDLLSAKFKSMGSSVESGFKKMANQADKFKNKMSGIGKMAANVKSEMASFAKRFGPAAIAVGITTKAIVSFGQAIEFVNRVSLEFAQTMSTVKAILKPNEVEMAALSAESRKLGETTVFTATEAGRAFVELGKLGLKTNQILAASKDVLNLAVVAQSEMSLAAEATARTLGQFSLKASNAGSVVDIMAKSFNISALDLNRFSESMKFVGSTSGQLGTDLAETTAQLAELASKGIVGSQAGTALRRIMLELGDANSKASKMIRGSASATASFTEKLKALQEKNLSPGTIKDTFGLLSSTAAGILISGTESIEKFNEELNNAEGTAKEFANTMLDNVGGATKLLKSAQEGLGLAIGDAFGSAKLKRIQFYTEVVNFFTGVVKANKEQFELLANMTSKVFLTMLNLGVASIRGIIGTFEFLNGVILKTGSVFVSFFGLITKGLNKLGADFDTTFISGMGENLGKEAEDAFERARLAAEGLDMSKAIATVQDAGEAIKSVDLAPTEPGGFVDPEKAEKERLAAEQKILRAEELQDRLHILTLEGQERDNAALQFWFQQQAEILMTGGEDLNDLFEAFKIKESSIRKKFDDKAAAEIQKKLKKDGKDEETLKANAKKFNNDLIAGKKALTDTLIAQGSRGLQAFIKDEKTAKKIALITSIVQGALAVQRALASAPPPLNFISAAAVGAVAVGNTATIASQALVDGGFPQGRNARIKVNEEGQESVLNARATAGLGVGGVNALNSGQQVQNTSINGVTFAPVINIANGSGQAIMDALEDVKPQFSTFIEEEIIEKGYADYLNKESV